MWIPLVTHQGIKWHSDVVNNAGAKVRLGDNDDVENTGKVGLVNSSSTSSAGLGDNTDESPSRSRVVLEGVSGEVMAGEMLVIMGPSGAGKSKLLDILAGQKTVGEITGTLVFDGVVGRSDEVRLSTSYVRQSDLHYDSLTVRETLMFASLLRIPDHMDRNLISYYIEKTLKLFNLENIADSFVGGTEIESRGISGGEARRLSIAVETVHMPNLNFLDGRLWL
mgnify:CR=1 FL=1